MTIFTSSPWSICPTTCSSGWCAAQASRAWPIRPLAPVIIIFVTLFEQAARLHGPAQSIAVLRRQRRQRQTIFLLDLAHHRQGGFHRNGVGFKEQVFEQRVVLLMNSQGNLGPTLRKGPHQLNHG